VLQDEYLKILATVYFLSKGNMLYPVSSSEIAQKLSIGDEDAVSKIMYLDGKGYVKGNLLFQWEAMANITSRGIDYIENPYDSLRKDEGLIVSQTNNLNISNVGSPDANINIIDSSIIQRNSVGISEGELNEINSKLGEILDGLKKVNISNEGLLKTVDEIKESLRNSDRVVAAQKVSKLQRFISGVRDFNTLLQATLLVYQIIGIIFHV
jgi:hypothetical protein